jgi:hypothetical protein
VLTHPTLDLLHDLGLHGMAKGFKELEQVADSRSLKHAEWLGLLLEHEVTLRRQKRFEARARTARLRHNASVEDIDYRAARGLDRALFLKLASCDFIRERRNLLISGPCGVGKSFLACARPQGLPRGLLRSLSPHAAAVCSPRARPRRRPLRQAPAHTRPRRSSYPRRLGTRATQSGSAPRSLGNHRGPLRRPFTHHHKPASSRTLVRDHRRSDARRRHPRSHHPQRL